MRDQYLDDRYNPCKRGSVQLETEKFLKQHFQK